MHQLDKLKAQRKEIYRIARKHRARKLYVFGSCARREETPESDVDFLAEFDKPSQFEHAGLEYDLAEYLNCPVDVVSTRALKNDSFEHEIRKDMVLL